MMYINSLGGKDASCREVPKVGDRPRVAVFGDSFAEGWGLPYEQSLPGHLQQMVGTKGIEVLGFGVASYCPSLTEKWMRKLVDSGVRWNMAVVLIDAGDAWEEMHEYKDFIEGRQKMRPSNKPRFFKLKWYEYSLTVEAVTILHQSLFSKKQALSDWEMAQEGNNWKLQWLQKPEAKTWLRSGLVQEGQAVERILQMGKEYNFPVLLVVYPYPVMMAHSWLDNEHTRYWKKVALKNGVALADLSSEFVEKGAEPKETYKKYFIPGDFHWNNEGNNLVARALVPRIMEKLASP
jgi:lysophospholipase L1-like esterase